MQNDKLKIADVILNRGKLNLSMIMALLMFFICVSRGAAAISLVFAYDLGTNTTTATYSGSWGTFAIEGTNPIGVNWSEFSTTRFVSFADGSSYSVDFSVSVNGGAILPWIGANDWITSRTGDNFGFRTDSNIYAPAGYIQGTAISGTMVFAGRTLSDLSLSPSDNGIIAVGGAGNNIQLTVIPEPSATLLGGFGLLALLRRRR